MSNEQTTQGGVSKRINHASDLGLTADAVLRSSRPPMPAAVANLYHCTADNIGDLLCGPAQYLWPGESIRLPLSDPGIDLAKVIIGGGQIFSQLDRILTSVYSRNPAAKTVGWGIGLPLAGVRDDIVKNVAGRFTLFGTRNYDQKDYLPFVPCASCLNPLFDQVATPTHELVFYLHRRKGDQVDIPNGVPRLTNANQSAKNVIEFIASGETVVTSSYHGVYWAQLLGRRVICLPYNDKFKTFEHCPTMAPASDWQSAMPNAARIDPLLEQYRAINHSFAQRVMDIWND